MGQLKGKVAIVTGAGQGIGQAITDGGGHIGGVPWDPGLPDEPLEL